MKNKKIKKAIIRNGIIFYYLENDRYIGQRIALDKYEPYETELILRQAKDCNVVIDVGANIGYYTILLAKKIGNNGKVFAFEPDSTNFSILEKNIKANKLKNVVSIKAAVSNKNGAHYLYKSEDNLGDHKLSPPQSSFKKEKVLKEKIRTIRLDDYFKKLEQKINLIKIDTQGWEPEVFLGAKKIIGKDKPIIFFEYSPASYKEAKLDGQKMMKWLKGIYKKIFWIDEWLYIYKVLDKKRIDQICASNKTGYADIWVKKEVVLNDKIGQYRDLKIKKLIKKIIWN
jgi:FkbM family methyltransferase